MAVEVIKHAGIKLSFEGAATFEKTLKQINSEMKLSSAELQKVTAEYGKSSTSIEVLTARQKDLESRVRSQKEVTQNLSNALKEVKDKYGENSVEANKMQAKVLESEAAEIRYKNALESVNDKITEKTSVTTLANKEIENITGEMKLSSLEMGKLTEQYSKNKDSVQFLTEKQKNLETSLKSQQDVTANLNKILDEARSKYGENSKEVQDLKAKILESETAEISFKNSLEDTNKKLAEKTSFSGKINSFFAEFKRGAEETNKELIQLGENIKASGEKMKSIGKNLTTHVTAPIVAIGGLSAKAAVDFESAFAGVRKTTDATEAEFAKLEAGIRDMAKEIPASAVEIAGVAEAAGQLGIQTDSILGFTRTMIDLGESTNLSSSQAADSLARFANITQMSQNDFDKLGSVIVDLGNNFATTESEIVEMGMRLAGAGTQVGLTQSEIMAFATSLSSVGIQAEMGGSAFSKAMINMQVASEIGPGKAKTAIEATGLSLRELELLSANSSKDFKSLCDDIGYTATEMNGFIKASKNLEDFANVAGMTADEFSAKFRVDASGAIKDFIVGLSKMEEDGISAIATLDEMGFKEVRLRDTLLRATNANELFTDSLKVSNEAWEENNALANEAEQRYATTESQIEILKNNLTDVGITLGQTLLPIINDLLDTVKPMIQSFGEMDESQQKTILTFAAVAAAAGPLISVLGVITSVAGGAIATYGSISGGIAMFTGAAATGTAGATAFAGALTAMTGPVGLAALGIAGITMTGIALYKHFSEELIPEIDHFGEGISKATQEATTDFLEMNEQVTRDLVTLSVTSGEVTAEMKDSIVSNIGAMAGETKAALEATKEESLNTLNALFEDTLLISEEEKKAIINSTTETYDEKRRKIEQAESTIAGIMERASDEKRALTDKEREVITKNQELIATEGIKHLTDSEREQKIILEKMKDNASLVSAQQAAEVVKNAVEQKEQVIQEAEEQYDKTLAEIIKQRDEIGSISEEQAELLIKEAKRQKDKSISNAEEMHKKIVEQAQEQAKEHVDKVNWETGEILTKWDEFKRNTSKEWDEIKKNASEAWENMKTSSAKTWSDMTSSISQSVEDMKTNVSNKVNEIKTEISNKWDEIMTYLKGIDLAEIGKNIIGGLTIGIKNAAGDVVNAAKDVARDTAGAIKEFFSISSPSKLMIEYGGFIGKGLEIGLNQSSKDLVKIAEDISDTISDSLHIDPAELVADARDAVEHLNRAIPSLENNIQLAEAQRQQNSISSSTTFNFDGFLRGANFVVREEQDINKIANAVIDILSEKVQQNSRIGGIAIP